MKFKFLRYICLILCISFLISGCDGGEIGKSGESGESLDTSDDTSGPMDPSKFKVGFIYNQEKETNDSYLNFFEKTRKDLENSLEIKTVYIENVLVNQFEDAAKALKNDGCQVIVATSFIFANTAYNFSAANPDVFIVGCGAMDFRNNLTVAQPKIYQAAFLGGTVASWNSKSNKLGIVTDSRMSGYIAAVNGFTLGVQQLKSTTETDVNVAYSSTDSETKTAIDQLVADGCDVIMVYLNSEYGIKYCNEIGVKVIGYTDDIKKSAPDTGLLGFYENWSTYMIDEIRSVMNHNFTQKSFAGGISEGMIRISNYTEVCAKNTDTIVETLYNYVKKGKATIFDGEIKNTNSTVQVAKGRTLTHPEIMKMNYFVLGVRSVNNYVEPSGEISGTDFEIKH